MNMSLIYSKASSDVIFGCGEHGIASTRSAGDQSFVDTGDIDNEDVGGGNRGGAILLLGDGSAVMLSVKSVDVVVAETNGTRANGIGNPPLLVSTFVGIAGDAFFVTDETLFCNGNATRLFKFNFVLVI